MHKTETTKIVLITVAVLAVIVINAWILTNREPDILDVPETEQSDKPVPDFNAIDNVSKKKTTFFNYLRPEVEKQNEYLLSLRHYIQTLQRKVNSNEALSDDDKERIDWLVEEYAVEEDLDVDDQIAALLKKVDILPVELVLAQAANESAWGTSRFAQEGYNFFGLWCFKRGCGFVPSRRTKGADHEVAKFPNLSRATYTYMRNLNRHYAYRDLRNIRSTLRANQLPVTGVALAEGLLNYSERGVAYVEELQAMIRFNQEFLAE
ncbi:mannosyl-glycoprotein endo-beta-N-acetylglucosamidase [Alteromonas pelagimontana]|uniref:Mannosyl-glycoprotein endo-beta-N-acetylglucosamidase n=1 Tax=Alteromonas pelagimontana TaxID=1858656 RepID=A0A6M4MIC3_9ALTE|nr:glucosaminidase domain-containing protein [Alteromonas pelagimontana]QJR79310.1 mannosyl-glycoprotein endo-beta-N-acetylglucosamidase [Alteromonas pelagimontana]QJR82668.1 mannosyl-glycoprotein endo-beta-N-acetylglucosamidase [Alteromonas pelagimontana]